MPAFGLSCRRNTDALPHIFRARRCRFLLSFGAAKCYCSIMTDEGTARLRWLGVVVLGIALLMLVAGLTLLQGQLGKVAFVVYWLVCLLLTGAAILVAFADIRATHSLLRKQERALLEEAMREIEAEARTRAGRN
jgi:hypothetical protein